MSSYSEKKGGGTGYVSPAKVFSMANVDIDFGAISLQHPGMVTSPGK